MDDAAIMTKSEILLPGRGSAILAHPDFAQNVEPAWFSANSWGEDAVAVDSGGRGSAWFVDSATDRMVLRHYLRGGYVAYVSRDAYIYLGAEKTRSFAEFRLLNHLHGMGLPVPKPVAARYERLAGIAYRASILITRIADVTPLGVCFKNLQQSDWMRLGQLLRRFHDAGVYHADLNCFNILVRGSEFFLIDFDKGELIPGARDGAQWKVKNLDRLHRSFLKVVSDDRQSLFREDWGAMLKGYGMEGRRRGSSL